MTLQQHQLTRTGYRPHADAARASAGLLNSKRASWLLPPPAAALISFTTQAASWLVCTG